MCKRSRLIQSLETTKFLTYLEIEVYYDAGGINYFTGNVEPRGIYLSVTPVERTDNWKSYKPFDGTRSMVKELRRFSQKQFDSFVPSDSYIQRLVDHTLKKNDLKLKQVESFPQTCRQA